MSEDHFNKFWNDRYNQECQKASKICKELDAIKEPSGDDFDFLIQMGRRLIAVGDGMMMDYVEIAMEPSKVSGIVRELRNCALQLEAKNAMSSM